MENPVMKNGATGRCKLDCPLLCAQAKADGDYEFRCVQVDTGDPRQVHAATQNVRTQPANAGDVDQQGHYVANNPVPAHVIRQLLAHGHEAQRAYRGEQHGKQEDADRPADAVQRTGPAVVVTKADRSHARTGADHGRNGQ